MTPRSEADSESRRIPRRFRRLYVLALGTVAILAIAGQVLVQHVLATQLNNGRVVNQAGLQRMLSQRLTLKLLLLDEADPSERAERASEILELNDRWKAGQNSLIALVEPQAPNAASRASLSALLDTVHRSQQTISSIAQTVVRTGELTPVQRAALIHHQEVFLPLMDATVHEFELAGAVRVTWLQRVELGLLTLTLIVLAVEALIVFRPAVEQLQTTLDELEIKRRHSVDRLESLRHLSGGIAHHFNNILTSIMGNAELTRLESRPNERCSEYAGAQIEQCTRAANLIRQLLLYAGERGPRLTPVALGEWLSEMVVRATRLNSRLNVELRVLEDAVAQIDTELLEQAMDGLLANAQEAMSGRPGAVVVSLSQVVFSRPRLVAGPEQLHLPAGLYAAISVSDSGVGIDPSEVDRIFDPFYSQKSFGRGMGLASILGVAHAHTGGLEVRSEIGSGTTFSLYFPISIETPVKAADRVMRVD